MKKLLIIFMLSLVSLQFMGCKSNKPVSYEFDKETQMEYTAATEVQRDIVLQYETVVKSLENAESSEIQKIEEYMPIPPALDKTVLVKTTTIEKTYRLSKDVDTNTSSTEVENININSDSSFTTQEQSQQVATYQTKNDKDNRSKKWVRWAVGSFFLQPQYYCWLYLKSNQNG